MTLQDLLDKVHEYAPPTEDILIARSFRFAQKIYAGKLNVAGEPYMTHAIEMAIILADIKIDISTVCATLLYKTITINPSFLKDIKKEFGVEISKLVEGYYHLSKIHLQEKTTEEQVYLLQKIAIVISKDPRALLIKIASRFQFLRILEKGGLNDMRDHIAKESMAIFVPLADILGVWRLRWQLADICFRILQPKEYQQIYIKFDARKKNHLSYIGKIKKILIKESKKQNLSCSIEGRFKNFYSIYQKMVEKRKEFDEIYDVFAIRIIVDTISQCYLMLGIVHSLFPPLPGRMKDYIALPKQNGYQSLHTTVNGPNNHPIEFQIRTESMHQKALYGIAAHWYYKRKNKDGNPLTYWMKNLLRWQKYSENSLIASSIKLHILDDRIFVFTPTRDFVELPINATPIDFAYSIHSSLGHRCHGAMVNDKEVPLNTSLHSGDIVYIILQEYEDPSHMWLSFVKTNAAKHAIQTWIKNHNESPEIRHGKTILQKVLSQFLNISLASIEKRILAKFPNYTTLEQLYIATGKKELSVIDIVRQLYTTKELLFSPTRVTTHSYTEHKNDFFVSLTIQTRIDQYVLDNIIQILLSHSIDPVTFSRKAESIMNRFCFSITCYVSSVEQLYKLFVDIDRMPEVESVMKQ